MKKITLTLLFLIMILGGFLRIYNLSGSPPSLNWDEAAWGYNAYSISRTLKDEYGVTLPIFTRSFDEYKSTLSMYLMIPTIHLFGLNEVGVRLSSAVIGTLAILVIFFIVKELFDDDRIALISSLLFAVEPWAVHLSRVYYDANEAMFFLLLGLLLFLYSKRKSILLPMSVIAFMISMYTYNSDKILVPLFLIILAVLNRNFLSKLPKKTLKLSLAAIVLFTVPFIVLSFAGQAFARVTSTNIFVLWASELSPKIYYFTWDVAGRYLAYFSPYNLFIREPQEPTTIVAGNSIFYIFEFIPLIVGLFYLFRNIKKFPELFILIIISPLPAIVTWNWFQPGRTMALFAVYSIIIAVGIMKILNFIFQKIKLKFLIVIAYLAFVLFVLLNAFYLFDSINVFLPFRDAGNYQPGFRETVPEVMKLADNYSQIIIDTSQAQPYIFYLFYGKYDPAKYLSQLDLNYIGTPRKHYDFGKFHFRVIDWTHDKDLRNTLFVGDAKDFPNVKPLEDIKDRYGNVINYLVATD